MDLAYARKRLDKLNDIAIQIGRMNVAWSALEMDMTLFLNELTRIEDRDVKNILLGSMDMKMKTAALRNLGFSKRPSDEIFDELNEVIKLIDQDLTKERNRNIHDFWTELPNQDGIQRLKLRAEVKKDNTKRVLKLATFENIEAADIEKTYEKILHATVEVDRVRRSYVAALILNIDASTHNE